jgi:hypothetical protein
MKKSILLFIIATVGLFSCKQSNNSKTGITETKVSDSIKNIQNKKTFNNKDIHTKYEYTDSKGKRVIIQNGYPRGGIKYTDPNGNEYGYAIFWTQVINETDNPLELKIDFPTNSYEVSNFPGKYFKILVPADTMTLDKIPVFMYGLKNIESFLDNNMHKPSSFQRNINPKESSGFYFLMLILTKKATGMARTGLSLKGQDLFYKISRYSSTKPISLIDEKEIHCGSINLKNLKFHN